MSEKDKRKFTKNKQTVHDSIELDASKNQKLQKKNNKDELKMEKKDEAQMLIDIANIKKEINEIGYEENPQMKFCVRVEVEEYNEDVRHNIKIEIDNPEGSNAAQSSNAKSRNNQDKLSNGKLSVRKRKDHLEIVDIDLKRLYNEVNKIADTSTNPADQILAIELKNNWGMVLRPAVDNDPINAKIQDIIHKWKNWLSASKYRDTPIFYKCYICKKAWWHLGPFRAHLPRHHIDTYRIELEEQLHEASVIAYGTINVPKVQYLKADGECWKCNNPFEFHVSSKKHYATYLCKYCEDRFYTCTDLQAHQGVCWQYLKHREIERDEEMKICSLCRCLFPTTEELNQHLTTRHAVRSDHPIQSQYKICSTCNSRYFIYGLHHCPKKLMNFNCERCSRGFSSTLLVDIHTRLTESNVDCRICRKRLPKKCMEMLHYQNHTDQFKMAYKCAICTHMEVYLDEQSAKRHRHLVHRQRYDKRRNYFEKVLLPRSYFHEEGAVVQRMIVPLVIEEPVESDFPIFEAKEVKKTYQAKSKVNPEDELKLALSEIKREMDYDDDMFAGCDATIEEHTLQSHVDGSLVFHEEPISEEPILPEDVKMEIKSEPMDEEYEDDIIRLSIELPPEPEYELVDAIKQEPEDHITIKQEVEHKEILIPESSHPRLRPMAHRQSKFRYPCSRCNRTFLTAKKYLLHFTTHGIEYMCCPVCLQSFENVTRLLPHLTSHVKQTYLKMRVIDKSAPGKKRKHARSKAKYQCKECKSKVEHDNLYSHWDTHFKTGWKRNELDDRVANDMSLQSEGLKMVVENLVASKRNMLTKDCVICHRHFERKNDSKRHLIEHLLTDAYCNKPLYGALRCQICHVGFQKPDHYKLHMRDHGSLPVYRCEICDKAFSDSSNFTKHKKVHNLQAVICDICSKKFQAKASLVKHLEMHRTTKPITCQLCQRVSYTESAYKKHIRSFHNRANVKVKCQLCGKKYGSLKAKWDHLWLVHKERKHKADCPICKKQFRRLIDVKKHLMKDHSVLPARKARRTDDIEEFLHDNPSLEMTEGETLIVYE